MKKKKKKGKDQESAHKCQSFLYVVCCLSTYSIHFVSELLRRKYMWRRFSKCSPKISEKEIKVGLGKQHKKCEEAEKHLEMELGL